jgi:hypothetical protein
MAYSNYQRTESLTFEERCAEAFGEEIGSYRKCFDEEQHFLAELIAKPGVSILEVKEHLEVKHFRNEAHQLILNAVFKLAEDGKAVDKITVSSELAKAKYPINASGLEALEEIVKLDRTGIDFLEYAKIIMEKYRTRESMRLIEDLKSKCEQGIQKNPEYDVILEQLRELHDNSADEIEILDLDAMIAADCKTEWLVKDLIAKRRITGLAGRSTSGKSWMALELAVSMATGRPVFGKYEVVQPAGVLYINADNPQDMLAKRVKTLLRQDKLKASGNLSFLNFPNLSLKESQGIANLRKSMSITKPSLVILDSLSMIWGVKDINQNAEIQNVFQNLRSLSNEFGCSILYLHHNRKAPNMGKDAGGGLDKILGAQNIANMSDSIFSISKRDGQNSIKVQQHKNRDNAELAPFLIECDFDSGLLTAVELEYDLENELDNCVHAIGDWFEDKGPGFLGKRAEIVKAIKLKGFSTTTIDRSLQELACSTLEKEKRGVYRLRNSQITPQVRGYEVGDISNN